MISQHELERAIARWKARHTGQTSEGEAFTDPAAGIPTATHVALIDDDAAMNDGAVEYAGDYAVESHEVSPSGSGVISLDEAEAEVDHS